MCAILTLLSTALFILSLAIFCVVILCELRGSFWAVAQYVTTVMALIFKTLGVSG